MNLYKTVMEKYGKKPKPILFNTEMTRAFKEDRKTQTRRNPFFFRFLDGFNPDFTGYSLGEYMTGNIENGVVLYSKNRGCWRPVTEIEKPPYVPGDILYVRETWKAAAISYEGLSLLVRYQDKKCEDITFEYDRFHKFKKYYDKNGWQSSIFMPKEASRIFLRVTDVRVQRIQEITPAECRAEGIDIKKCIGNSIMPAGGMAVVEFADLWDDLYKGEGYSWDLNPWVWVIELEKLEVA